MNNKNDDFSKIEDFSENAHRVRRNLLIFTCVNLILYYSGNIAEIHKVNILGAELNNIPKLVVPITLLIITIYHWCHFLWLVIEHCKYNLLALSRVGKKGIYGNIGAIDTNYDNWNLYLWWKRRVDDFDKKFEQANKIIDENLEFYKTYTKQQNYPDDYKNSIYDKIRTTESNFLGIKQTLEQLKEIEQSLEKFNDDYKSYSLISRYRWYIVEFGVPIALGLLSVVYLSREIQNNM